MGGVATDLLVEPVRENDRSPRDVGRVREEDREGLVLGDEEGLVVLGPPSEHVLVVDKAREGRVLSNRGTTVSSTPLTLGHLRPV